MKAYLAAIVLLFSACIAANAQNLAPQKPRRIRVSERLLDTVAVKKVLPSTPCSKDAEHEKGVVTIAVLGDYDGKVKSASLLSGDSVLADCAILAIQQWEFKPYLINDNPVQVESRIVMKFSKERAEIVFGER
jgi:periplasmic protein TonB